MQIFLVLFGVKVPCQQPSYEGERHISQSPGDTAKAYDVSTFGDAGDLSANAQGRLEQWQHGGERQNLQKCKIEFSVLSLPCQKMPNYGS